MPLLFIAEAFRRLLPPQVKMYTCATQRLLQPVLLLTTKSNHFIIKTPSFNNTGLAVGRRK
jgi:hypothetical protein